MLPKEDKKNEISQKEEISPLFYSKTEPNLLNDFSKQKATNYVDLDKAILGQDFQETKKHV